MIIATNIEKAVDKIQQPLMTKNTKTKNKKNPTISKLGIEGTFPSLIKNIIYIKKRNPTANILDGKKLKAFSLR